jgi:hypothetical protein
VSSPVAHAASPVTARRRFGGRSGIWR